MNSVLVAFSGGVDSSFLLKTASMCLPKEKILAVTAISETYPSKELRISKAIAKNFGCRHKIIKTFELKNPKFASNPVNRCYFCKKELFSKLKRIAVKNNLAQVIDANNFSDIRDYRPGAKAKKELKVRSPLQEAKFTKEEIRSLSNKFGIKVWNKPSLACLASRIPYGTEINKWILRKVEKAEEHLFKLGFPQSRVRHYGALCRVEVPLKDIPKLIKKRKLIVEKFKKLGYNYITIDLEGYRTGSMNIGIPNVKAQNSNDKRSTKFK